MGKTLDAWSRFLILDELLRNRNNYYLLNELVDKVNDALEEYGYEPVSKRTIQEDLKFMKSERGWGIELRPHLYFGREKLYHYDDDAFSIMNMPITQAESELLSEAIAMLGRFRMMPGNGWLESVLRILRIRFNVDSSSVSVRLWQNEHLKGLDWFEPLLDACKRRLILTMDYLRFDRQINEPVERIVKPFQMRQYNNRWYLVGSEDAKLPRLQMVVVPIDRIVALSVETVAEREARERSGGGYAIPSEEKIEAYFKDIVGVSRWAEGMPEIIRVKAWGMAQHYLETKPMHLSQRIVEVNVNDEGDTYKIFEWRVIPNEELVQALIVYADEIEVVEGDFVKNKLRERAEKILKNVNR